MKWVTLFSALLLQTSFANATSCEELGGQILLALQAQGESVTSGIPRWSNDGEVIYGVTTSHSVTYVATLSGGRRCNYSYLTQEPSSGAFAGAQCIGFRNGDELRAGSGSSTGCPTLRF